jgi:hypothetical protein
VAIAAIMATVAIAATMATVAIEAAGAGGTEELHSQRPLASQTRPVRIAGRR